MPIPPEPVVRAAKRWLDLLPTTSPARARTLFATYAHFNDLTSTQYESGYALLKLFGLVPVEGGTAYNRRRLFEALLETSQAPWLTDADSLVRTPDELPEDAHEIAAVLGLTDVDAFASVKFVGGKVSLAEREAAGAAGEAELVSLLEANVLGRVEQVSLTSDGFGYDILVTSPAVIARLEVKSTSRINQVRVFISRHEYEVMCVDPDWEMVVVQLSGELKLRQVFTVSKSWIRENAPLDASAAGRWESVRLRIPSGALTTGIPKLHDIVRATGSLLGGAS